MVPMHYSTLFCIHCIMYPMYVLEEFFSQNKKRNLSTFPIDQSEKNYGNEQLPDKRKEWRGIGTVLRFIFKSLNRVTAGW